MDDVELLEIQVNGCQIAVVKQDNNVPKTIVFVHGNSLTQQIWEKQFSGGLYEHYNLIAFDLPGHGDSSRPANPEQVYTLDSFRNLLQEILQYFALEQVILVGHSLGGHIILESLPYLPHCEAAVVIGTPPLKKPIDAQELYLPNPYLSYFFSPDAPAKELMGWSQAMMRKNAPQTAPSFLMESYRRTDPLVRMAVGAVVSQGLYDDEVEILADTSIPVTLVLGEDEQLINREYLHSIPKISGWPQVVIVPGAGHLVPYENPLFFNRMLVQLLSVEPTV